MIPEMLVGQRCRIAGETEFSHTVVAIWLHGISGVSPSLWCAVVRDDGFTSIKRFENLTFDKLQSPFRLYDPER